MGASTTACRSGWRGAWLPGTENQFLRAESAQHDCKHGILTPRCQGAQKYTAFA